MEKKLKTIDVVKAYNVLSKAKYQKLRNEDMIKVWRIQQKLKHYALEFDEAKKDAEDKLLPEDFMKEYQKALVYESKMKKGELGLPMTAQEHSAFIVKLQKCNTLIKKALEELENKEVSIDFDTISEIAFAELMSSNEWTFEDADVISFIIE